MTALDYVIRRACERNGHNSHEFSTAHFQSELSEVTKSRPMVTPQVAELLLMSVTGVNRVGLCMWNWAGLGGAA